MDAEGSIYAEGRKLSRVSGLLYFRRPGAPGRVSRPTAIRYHHLPPSCNTFLHEAPVGIEPTNGRFAVSHPPRETHDFRGGAVHRCVLLSIVVAVTVTYAATRKHPRS